MQVKIIAYCIKSKHMARGHWDYIGIQFFHRPKAVPFAFLPTVSLDLYTFIIP